jgi:hypothetical protein
MKTKTKFVEYRLTPVGCQPPKGWLWLLVVVLVILGIILWQG